MWARDSWRFVALTFLISVPAGGLAFWLFGEQTFGSPGALPLLLITIWAPNIAAVLLSAARRELWVLWAAVWRRGSVGAWLSALLPLSIAAALGLGSGALLPGPGALVGLVAINLVMGPLAPLGPESR